MNNGKKTLITIAKAALLLSASSTAYAQTAPEQHGSAVETGGGLADIVVTAQRRQERLQDTPIAITAFQGGALEARSAPTITSLSSFVPNLNSTTGVSGGNYANFYIRGIGQGNQDATADPGVGLYIDGVYLARTNGADLATLDVERIEVLRGPQGTLFGKNTPGGAISITTVTPNDTFGGSIRFIGGSRNHFEGRASINIPLSETLQTNFSVNAKTEDGYGKRIGDGARFGDKRSFNVRGAVKWQPTPELSVILRGDYTHESGTFTLVKLIGAGPILLANGYSQYVLNDKSYNTYANHRDPNKFNGGGGSLTAEWNLTPDIAIKSITAYRAFRQRSGADFDAGPLSLIDEGFYTKEHQFSEELQLGGKALNNRLDFVVGGYYFKESIDQAVPLFAYTATAFNQLTFLKIENLSGFGQATFHINDIFSITAGGRYTHERKDQSAGSFLFSTYDAFYTLGIDDMINTPASLRGPTLQPLNNLTKSFNSFTPKISLDAKISPNVLLYASYSKGFKSGGFNARASGNASSLAYAPETLDSYEVGTKLDLLDRKVRLNLAGFLGIYKDLQLYVLRVNSDGALVIENRNAAKARIYGLESELTVTPVYGLLLNASVGYLQNKYLQLDQSAILAGVDPTDKLPYAPKWSVNIGGQYTYDFSDGSSATARLDYSYKSKYYTFAANNPLDAQEKFGLFNARVSFRSKSGISGAVFVKNIFDKYYSNQREDVRSSYGIALDWPGEPRTFGVELGYKF